MSTDPPFLAVVRWSDVTVEERSERWQREKSCCWFRDVGGSVHGPERAPQLTASKEIETLVPGCTERSSANHVNKKKFPPPESPERYMTL